MADRVSASIVIGGTISGHDYVELVAIIADEGLSIEWDGEPFSSAHRFVGKPLELYAHEVAWGRFATLESWCVAKRVPFIRSSGGYGSEWGAQRVVFTGEGLPISYPADENGRVMACRGTIEKLGSVDAVIAYFNAADLEVPPLVVAGLDDGGPRKVRHRPNQHMQQFNPPFMSGHRAGLIHFWRSFMADYYCPTVVQPNIPAHAITRLERALLTQMFDHEFDGEAFYFFSEEGPSNTVQLNVAELKEMLEDEAMPSDVVVELIRAKLVDAGPEVTDLEIDLSDLGEAGIFQAIVRRCDELDHVTITSAWTCSKMRPDGFGGGITVVTADHILSSSTSEREGRLLDQAEHGDLGCAPGHGEQVTSVNEV